MSTPFRFKNADNTTVDFEDYYVRADYFRSGNLWLWGANFYGFGDNTTAAKSSPVQTIARGSNWKQVACGQFYTAAIKTDGTLWTSGDNTQGGLGDNTLVNKISPVQTVAGGTNWKQVSGGQQHTAAIKTDGTLWTWGLNGNGQLGDNTITKKSSPVQTVAFGTNWKSVACGLYHTVALKTDGTLWVWGINYKGVLGENSETSRSSPIQTIAFGTNWKNIACGAYYSIAIKEDGTLWTWGHNSFGQLGDNTTASKSSPVQTIAGGINWKIAANGGRHAAVIKTDGTLWTWGWNGYGQLGDNTRTGRSSPVQTITFGTNWKQVSNGYMHTSATKTDGTLWTWGRNNSGQLGDNTIINRSSPVQTVAGGTNWNQVSGGGGYTTAAIQYQDDYQ
jgi:alpha-tubulin suppressor-like RCC1 family protein